MPLRSCSPRSLKAFREVDILNADQNGTWSVAILRTDIGRHAAARSRREGYASLPLVCMVAVYITACGRSDRHEPSIGVAATDGGMQAAASTQEAAKVADDLELAYERHFACRGLPPEGDVWEGSNRDCFIALMAKRLALQDALSTCVREAAHAYSQCGEAAACTSVPCASAIFLDDNPIEEFVAENCGAPLDPASRRELAACR